jgi:uncharacterized protein CbrC (UPF0167 family)
MAAAAGSATGEATARALLQRHQPFAPPPGEYHNFGAAPADAGEEVVEAVVLRTPVSSGGLVVPWWSTCAENSRLFGSKGKKKNARARAVDGALPPVARGAGEVRLVW